MLLRGESVPRQEVIGMLLELINAHPKEKQLVKSALSTVSMALQDCPLESVLLARCQPVLPFVLDSLLA